MAEMQALMQQAREMLTSQGAPITTENLNRAMIMMTGSGDARTEQTAEGFDMNAQVDRVMQRSTGRPGTARPAAAPANTVTPAAAAPTATAPTTAPAANVVAERAAEAPATPVAERETVNTPNAAPSVGSMPTGRIPEEDPLTATNPLLNAAMQRTMRQQPTRMPVVSAEALPDETAGLGYDPRTEELDQYGRPQMRGLPRAEPTNNIMSPAYLGIPAAMMARAALPTIAAATRVTPVVSGTGPTRTATQAASGGPRGTTAAPTSSGRAALPPRGGSSAPVPSPQTPTRPVTVGNSGSAPMSAPPMIPPQVVSQNTMAVNQSSAFRAAMERAFRNGDTATQQRLLEAARAGAVR